VIFSLFSPFSLPSHPNPHTTLAFVYIASSKSFLYCCCDKEVNRPRLIQLLNCSAFAKMPPYPDELEEWWLTGGRDALRRLIDVSEVGSKPREFGFSQAIQHRLRAFDTEREIHNELILRLPEIRASRQIDFSANPRKSMTEASQNIFKKPEDGGMDYSRALEGLGQLDAMEFHRRRLLAATSKAISRGFPLTNHQRVIQELDRTARHRILAC
jgi:hypothetical protein